MNNNGIEVKLILESVSTDPRDTEEDAKAFCESMKELLESRAAGNQVTSKVTYKIINHNKVK